MDSDQRLSSSLKHPLQGITATALVAFAIMALASCGGTKQAAKPAPTQEETAYLQNIQLVPSRAEAAQNFLQHTVTTVYGTVTNKGNKTVIYLEINLTFSDIEGKPIDQRKAYPISGTTLPLKPGETREFRVSFDQVPPMWNQAVPKMAPDRVILAGE
jgi:hypothetical protein